MPSWDVISCNSVAAIHAQSKGSCDAAKFLFDSMLERNVFSWNTLILAFGSSERAVEANRAFERIPHRDLITWSSIVAANAENSQMDRAEELFASMPEWDVYSYNAMLS
ncbi:hypothetical protein SELMODRAFT_101593, partial [Selaginella moellendorffii]